MPAQSESQQPPSVFRKVSLDRLASPEQLDQLMQVTDPRGWVALAALGAVLFTAVMWGVFGTIPEKVGGTGILVKSGGIYEVIPTAGGRVVDVAVAVGEEVSEGQVVARVEQPDLADRLQQARVTLANLRAEHAQIVDFGGRDATLQSTYLAQQRASLLQSIAASEASVQALTERIESEEKLAQNGLVTKNTLLGTRQQLNAQREKIADARSRLTQIESQQLGLRNKADEDTRGSRARIQDQEIRVADLERQLRSASEVVAPYTGRILEVMTERGNVVAAGEPILSLDLTGRAVKDLEAVIYVPSVHGKRIRPGMTIQIAPSTVKQEEFGLMLGTVTYVSDFPATSKGMRRVLKNEKLVSGLSGGDAPYELHADLVVDPSTVSRYRWSSSKGPPLKIQSGTLATGSIEVSSRRPIEMVIPLLRKYTGI
jgi:HlyD family secretion protein